jgi:hypothetical protein
LDTQQITPDVMKENIAENNAGIIMVRIIHTALTSERVYDQRIVPPDAVLLNGCSRSMDNALLRVVDGSPTVVTKSRATARCHGSKDRFELG